MKDGVICINKPKGLTSRDVVNQISRIYKTKKVGHTGTLDPLATGVLIICVGKYTKLVNELTSKEKEYLATMHLGIKTDTADITGKCLATKKVTASPEQITESFAQFPREYMQTVPLYSAVKVNGKKLYEYARADEKVLLPKRKVIIRNLQLLKINSPEITFKTTVSKGTYIRSLIVDLAESFGQLATMQSLVRTKQGPISIEECFDLEEVTQETPLKTLGELFDYPRIAIDEMTKKKIINGNILNLPSTAPRVFLTFKERIIAIYEKKEKYYRIIFKVI